MYVCVNLNSSHHTNQLGSHLNFPLIISILEKKAGRHCQKIHWPSSRPQHWALVLWRIVNWYYSDDATRRCPELGVDHLRASQISWSRIQVRHCSHIRYRETIISLRTNTALVSSGLDTGDRQALEQKYVDSDPPCLLDSSDGRFVLKGTSYNPMDVANCLMIRWLWQLILS